MRHYSLLLALFVAPALFATNVRTPECNLIRASSTYQHQTITSGWITDWLWNFSIQCICNNIKVCNPPKIAPATPPTVNLHATSNPGCNADIEQFVHPTHYVTDGQPTWEGDEYSRNYHGGGICSQTVDITKSYCKIIACPSITVRLFEPSDMNRVAWLRPRAALCSER